MNTFQTTLAYAIAVLTLTAALWACVRDLRRRFAGEPCYSPPSKRVCVQGVGEPHLPDCRCSPPSEEDRRPLMEQLERKRAATFPAYVKGLSDEDLWAMKGLSKPLARIRKTEMDVRRRRKARSLNKQTIGTTARTDIIGHVNNVPVYVNPQGSLTLEDPKEVIVAKDPVFDTGADANGAPVLDGPQRWRVQLSTTQQGKAFVFGPYPQSDGLVATIDIFKHTLSSVYVETPQPFPEGGNVFERMDSDYAAWEKNKGGNP